MFTRYATNRNLEREGMNHLSVKQALRRKGWSIRRAAATVGRAPTHVCMVLNGQRESRSLLRTLNELGQSPVKYRESGYAVEAQS